jgi:hypothetical protein
MKLTEPGPEWQFALLQSAIKPIVQNESVLLRFPEDALPDLFTQRCAARRRIFQELYVTRQTRGRFTRQQAACHSAYRSQKDNHL